MAATRLRPKADRLGITEIACLGISRAQQDGAEDGKHDNSGGFGTEAPGYKPYGSQCDQKERKYEYVIHEHLENLPDDISMKKAN